MNYTDTLTCKYTDAAFQEAFRTYFDELGCRVTNWEGLFRGMGETGRDYTWTQRDESGKVTQFTAWMNPMEQDETWMRRDDAGRVVGFLQFTVTEMSCWFFRVKCGFIREFWVAPELRGQGHGSALLRMAESELAARGCACVLLTTDTAPVFYRKHGYWRLLEMTARNGDPVFCKRLLAGMAELRP